MHKLFRYPKFLETLKGRARKVSGTVRPKFFDGKTWYPPVIHKPFRNQNFSGKTVGFPFASFWHSETKQIRPKIVICPLLSVISFDNKNFLENRRVPLQNISFRSCETKKIRQNRDAPPLIHNFYSLPESVSETHIRRVPLRNF